MPAGTAITAAGGLASATLLIGATASTLQSAVTAIEQPFLEAGEGLQGIHRETTDMADLSLSVAALIGDGPESGLVGTIKAVAVQAISRLAGSGDRADESLSAVDSLVSSLSALRDRAAGLKAMARRLEIINVYISVESSRTEETKHAFAPFTEQMSRLVESIQSLAKRMQAGIRETQDGQQSARDEVLVSVKQLGGLRHEADATVSSLVDEVASLAAAAVGAVGAVSAYLGIVAQQTGAIVTALQVHDIVRQQVEHVVESLREAERLGTERSLGAVLHIQAAQLSQSYGMIIKAYETISSAFDTVGDQTLLVDESLREFRRVNPDSGCDQSLFSRLHASVTALVEFLDSVREQESEVGMKMREVTAQVRDTSRRLSLHTEEMGELNEDLSLLALNAIISAERMAHSGRPLLVLATQTLDVSRVSTSEVQEIMDALDAVRSLAEKVSWADTTVGVESSLSSTLCSVRQGVARLGEMASDISNRADSVARTIRAARQQLSFLPSFADRLQQCGSDLRAAGGDRPSDSVLVAERYTMESERIVHLRALGLEADPKIPLAGGGRRPNSADGGDDLGDNVELF